MGRGEFGERESRVSDTVNAQHTIVVIIATLAQLVEQLTCNEQVVGSNPTGGSSFVEKDSESFFRVLFFNHDHIRTRRQKKYAKKLRYGRKTMPN